MHRTDSGQSLLEYGLILLLAAGVVLGTLSAVGVDLKGVYCQILEGFGVDACQQVLMDWDLYQGNCQAVNGKVCCDQYGYIFANEFSGEDYTLQVSGAHLTQGWGYGIFFRTQRNNGGFDGYNFQYDPGYGSGEFLFRKWINGYELSPIAREPAPQGFDWYSAPRDLLIEISGDTFTAFVDGKEVLSVTDDSYQEGGVGVRVWDSSSFCTDGVTVTRH